MQLQAGKTRQKFSGFSRVRGQGIIETVFMLIIFTALFAFLASISSYLYLQHAMITAAREGVRVAAVDPDMAAGGGVSDVQAYVQNAVMQLCGQEIDAGDVIVTPPDPAGIPGERTVQVEINYDMQNPVNVAGLMGALGASNTETYATIPVYASAVMRYEE